MLHLYFRFVLFPVYLCDFMQMYFVRKDEINIFNQWIIEPGFINVTQIMTDWSSQAIYFLYEACSYVFFTISWVFRTALGNQS